MNRDNMIRRIQRLTGALHSRALCLGKPRTCSCACGVTFVTPAELDDHFHEVFTPADDIAPDGQLHAEVTRPAPAPAPSADHP